MAVSPSAVHGDDRPQTGPETEKRFPPLKVPAGFRATLFACDPLIEYPSAIALGPRPGSIFVAVDYMTGLGIEIVRRDEIRLVEDTDGDGYADKATVYASGFNSIEGMTFHDGVVYAMHSPLLTALRDTDGDGVADERRDLLTGLGLPPEENPPRLHCANGIVWGCDGWLYLALGDHGCNVPRPEGDRLVLEGGGILRCRRDGGDLHVFATGLRNIYDVALDEDLNVFVRDNENDGGDYKIRVYHSFFGADHGYPYLYYERPDDALAPLADLGLGSSAGGLVYLERQFPPEYRGSVFFCEWGRAVVRYVPQRRGGGFAPLREIEFAAGAENDPYGFKPTDLVVERDGSLILADWADGQRPQRGRGRIYRVAATTTAGRGASADTPANRSVAEWIRRLDSESYYERIEAQTAIQANGESGLAAVERGLLGRRLGVRGRVHAVSMLALERGPAVTPLLFELANSDADPRVRAQAIRALADLHDPVLREHRLAAGAGDPRLAERLAELAAERDPRVLLEIAVALGRLRWPQTPQWAERHMPDGDAAIAHAVMQAMRRSENWPAIFRIIDESPRESLRSVGLRALADRAAPEVVDGLIERLRAEPDAARRGGYAELLARVHRKPAPWVYRGYRPPPRPANTVDWERTTQIEVALNRVLSDPDRAVRVAALRQMQREKIPADRDAIKHWLADEREPTRVAAILDGLTDSRDAADRRLLLAIVREKDHAIANRLAALARVVHGLDAGSSSCLLELGGTLEDGPVLASLLPQMSKWPELGAGQLLVRKLNSADAEVRAAAADALGDLPSAGGGESLRPLLEDGDARVRRAAAVAAGKLQIRAAADSLLKLTGDPEPAVRRASFDSLRLLADRRVLPLAVRAATSSETALESLKCIGAFGTPEHRRLVADVAKINASTEILAEAIHTLTRWSKTAGLAAAERQEVDRAIAELHGAGGLLVKWTALGPLTADAATRIAEQAGDASRSLADVEVGPARWVDGLASPLDPNGTVSLAGSAEPNSDDFWVGVSDLSVTEPADVQFLASSGGALSVWLNGRPIYQRATAGRYQPESERFDGTLAQGANRIVAQVSAAQSKVAFHVRFRRKSSRAEHEQLVQAALARSGNVERGRKLFFDAEKSQCVKCHRLDERGERVGPELTGAGSRFSRIHIIESILEPSRTIAPSFDSVTIALDDGRVVSGLKVAETDTAITLVDNQAEKHVLEKSVIEERRAQPTSIMPDGLEKRFTTDEFVDLIAFLVSLK